VTDGNLYPGTFRDYSRQAFRTSGVFGVVLLLIVLAVLAFDNFILGETHFTVWHAVMLGILFTGSVLITQLMARSLAGFGITSDVQGLTVTRGNSKRLISYGEISDIEKIRIPGWWPLRADLKPAGETARVMIRIVVRGGRPLTFVSGLVGEEELLETVRKAAGLDGVND
jgi:uncharacterized integral membrane protein